MKGVTHDYFRHRYQEFLKFLKDIEANVPPGQDLHLIVDNYATYKYARVKEWLVRLGDRLPVKPEVERW